MKISQPFFVLLCSMIFFLACDDSKRNIIGPNDTNILGLWVFLSIYANPEGVLTFAGNATNINRDTTVADSDTSDLGEVEFFANGTYINNLNETTMGQILLALLLGGASNPVPEALPDTGRWWISGGKVHMESQTDDGLGLDTLSLTAALSGNTGTFSYTDDLIEDRGIARFDGTLSVVLQGTKVAF